MATSIISSMTLTVLFMLGFSILLNCWEEFKLLIFKDCLVFSYTSLMACLPFSVSLVELPIPAKFLVNIGVPILIKVLLFHLYQPIYQKGNL